eukprot:1138969-Pelagomonas_calceolata.AAC.6
MGDVQGVCEGGSGPCNSMTSGHTHVLGWVKVKEGEPSVPPFKACSKHHSAFGLYRCWVVKVEEGALSVPPSLGMQQVQQCLWALQVLGCKGEGKEALSATL